MMRLVPYTHTHTYTHARTHIHNLIDHVIPPPPSPSQSRRPPSHHIAVIIIIPLPLPLREFFSITSPTTCNNISQDRSAVMCRARYYYYNRSPPSFRMLNENYSMHFFFLLPSENPSWSGCIFEYFARARMHNVYTYQAYISSLLYNLYFLKRIYARALSHSLFLSLSRTLVYIQKCISYLFLSLSYECK